MDDLIIFYFKKLTIRLEDENIESTSNKLENCFRNIFEKVIKKLQKSEDGILKRFDLRLDKMLPSKKIPEVFENASILKS